jgi:hypothetical protein
VPGVLFLVFFAVLCTLSWDRIGKQSADPHFVYLANAWLEGSLQLQKTPPHRNDWASYEWMRLRSGREVKGVWLDRNTGRFRTLQGDIFVIDKKEIDHGHKETRYFVSFPPGPAAVMVPVAAIWGYDANDVVVTVFFGALNVALMFLLLRRFSDGGRSGRSLSDNLWLSVLFGAGTVHLWCAVLGQVWFTALVLGATFMLLYLLAAIDARHPLLAGIFLAMGFATRTPLMFASVLFFAYVFFPGGAWRRGGWKEAATTLALFCVPCVIVGVLLLYQNHIRFESWTEFGHTYLAGGEIGRIRKFGLFNVHFLSKNLSAALTLLPRFQSEAPYILVSRHGMSLLLTTPVWIYLFRPLKLQDRDDVFTWRLLWLTVAAVATPALFYQNTGYEQFGYRFSLDYTPVLVLLLAVGRRPFSWVFKALVIVGIAVNTFGAITFKRFDQFYLPGTTFFDPD